MAPKELAEMKKQLEELQRIKGSSVLVLHLGVVLPFL
jgi:hypothetical protein